LCLAGATGIAPSASKFGGTDFQPTQRLERLFLHAVRRDYCFLKGFSCLLGSFYIELCKTARKTNVIVRFGKWSLSSWNQDILYNFRFAETVLMFYSLKINLYNLLCFMEQQENFQKPSSRTSSPNMGYLIKYSLFRLIFFIADRSWGLEPAFCGWECHSPK